MKEYIKLKNCDKYNKNGTCDGTKECEICSCKGNRLDCDFFKHVKHQAKKEYKFNWAQKVLQDKMPVKKTEEGYLVRVYSEHYIETVENLDPELAEALIYFSKLKMEK